MPAPVFRSLLLSGPLLLVVPALLAQPAAPQIHVQVTDKGTGQRLPCRLTLVDEHGQLADLHAEAGPQIAARLGVVYTASGAARISAAPGDYTLYVTRGSTYGLAAQRLHVETVPQEVRLTLEREVDTHGYIGSDTHIHTLEFSGHGDATGAERLVTLAGEGIEMPVATEHNRHTDYAPLAKATGVERFLTPVMGNEVTTPVGHFNIFPVRPGSTPPEFRVRDRAALFTAMRAIPGVRVVTMNHPRDLHEGMRPAEPARFHPVSGESLEGQPWTADGIEVINSGALQSDWMQPYRDWFALLNHGERVLGIADSDSHDVNKYIVGQGRTFIASTATRPDRINVDEACANYLSGKVLASLGLVTEMWVEDRFAVGDLATGLPARIKVRVRVRSPRWIQADRVELFANGEKIASQPILPSANVTKADVTFTLPRPSHDAWLVAIASGPGITEPYWPLARPYQPTRADWEPRVIGSTNPIRIDGDGDGAYTTPREQARKVLQAHPAADNALLTALASYDSAVAVQAASLLRERGVDLNAGRFRQMVEQSAPQVRQAFVAYQRGLDEAAAGKR